MASDDQPKILIILSAELRKSEELMKERKIYDIWKRFCHCNIRTNIRLPYFNLKTVNYCVLLLYFFHTAVLYFFDAVSLKSNSL